MEWLIGQQLPDGSWGGAICYQHDRILSTLAALLPLIRFQGHAAGRAALQRAQSYIWRNAHMIRSEICELVGFELLLPELVRQATQAGLQLPAYLDVYASERSREAHAHPARADLLADDHADPLARVSGQRGRARAAC